MDPHADFLSTIIAAPVDDAPRLVYADWLEENGQPERAEFIRVQIELANLECPRSHFASRWQGGMCLKCQADTSKRDKIGLLRHREQQLRIAIQPSWLAACSSLLRIGDKLSEVIEFHRGFVESITVSWQDWLTHHAAIMASTPLRKVGLATEPDFMERMSPTEINGVWYCTIAERLENGIAVWGRSGQGNNRTESILNALAVKWPSIEFELPVDNVLRPMIRVPQASDVINIHVSETATGEVSITRR